MKPLFDKSGGYRKLYSFTFATLIHLGTIRFCKRFVPYQEDPLGKISGQMVGAARSGRQNIIEASERAGTSKETEIKLTDVARASLAELLGDYEIFLAEKGVVPWSRHDDSYRAISQLRLPMFSFSDDSLHDYWIYFQEIRKAFDEWINHPDGVVVANSMIVLIGQTMFMLDRQIQHQGETFLKAGGFKERMHECRQEVRTETSPVCPNCGKIMCQRFSRSGGNAGKAFWGCTGYPDCKTTKEMGKEAISNDPFPSQKGTAAR